MSVSVLVIAAASMGACWSRPAHVVHCEPVVVYTPCTPVYVPCQPVTHSCQSTPLAPVVAETEEVKAELAEDRALDPVTEAAMATEDEDKDDESVLENIADSETEAIGFGGPGLDLGHLALDWGVASIGSGTLYPRSPPPISGGGGFFGGGGSSGSGGGTLRGTGDPSGAFPTTIINNNNRCCNGCHNGGDPVPEPLSMAMWGLGLGALGYRRWRMKANV